MLLLLLLLLLLQGLWQALLLRLLGLRRYIHIGGLGGKNGREGVRINGCEGGSSYSP